MSTASKAQSADSSALASISLDESRDLLHLEEVVRGGLQTFVKVGEALAEIRDRKLYRLEYHSFEEYLRAKWQLERRNAYDLILCAAVAKTVQCIAQIDRATARELGKLPTPELQQDALRVVVQADPVEPPTPSQMRAVVEAKLELVGKNCGPRPTPLQIETKIDIIEFDELQERVLGRLQTLVFAFPQQYEKTVRAIIREEVSETGGTGSELDATKTPLQWLTHHWMNATEEQRKMFDNFRAGMRGGT